jgi:hypothetical protein
MQPFTHNQWSSLIQALLSQLDSSHGQQRINCYSKLPYFFEDWLKGECICAAFNTFNYLQISVNENFQGIPKLDLGLDLAGSLCALELKHIPTFSRDSKSRFFGPKDSNAVRDFLKLHNFNPRSHILCKLLFLYGPTQLTHNHGDICQTSGQGLNGICLQCAMNLFIQKTGAQKVNWQPRGLAIKGMYLVEVDIR